MKWLLFFVVIGPEGSFVGFAGESVATVIDEEVCHLLGEATANAMTEAAILADFGSVFDYRCRPAGDAA